MRHRIEQADQELHRLQKERSPLMHEIESDSEKVSVARDLSSVQASYDEITMGILKLRIEL
jgi:hypothetical protein